MPIYCSDSVGTRDQIAAGFSERGWVNKRWGQSYNAGWGTKKWWYGVILNVADAPAGKLEAKRAAVAAANSYSEEMRKTVALCMNAKAEMRTYGGREDFDDMIQRALPVFAPTPAADAPSGGALTEAAKSGAGSAVETPPEVAPSVSRKLLELDQAATAGRVGDWWALARLARVLQREGRDGEISRMVRAMTRRGW